MNSREYSIKEFFVSGIIFLIVTFAFLILTGVLPYEYYLKDDHEVFTILKMLENAEQTPILSVIQQRVYSDFNIRFRPLYQILRVIKVALFQDCFTLWEVFNGFECAMTLTVLYAIARKLKNTITNSVFFAAIVVIGLQMEAWFRLGPQEGTGMFLFAISFLLLIIYVEKNVRKYLVESIIFLILATLMKESFVLLIPAMLFYLIWNRVEEPKKITSWQKCFQRHGVVIGFLGAILILELFIIVFCVGTNEIGYAGIAVDTSLYDYYRGLIHTCRVGKYIGLMLVCIIIFDGLTFIIKLRKKGIRYLVKSDFCRYLMGEIFFVILLMLPQMVLYAKSGMQVGRYFLPVTFACAYYIIIIHQKYNINFKNLSKLLIGIFLLGQLHMGIDGACNLAKQGEELDSLFQFIIEGTQEESNIVFTYTSNESNLAVYKWLEYNGRESVYYYDEVTETFAHCYRKSEDDLSYQDIDFLIVKESNQERIFQLEYDFVNATKNQIGRYFVYSE